jgi:CRISPR-associated protein Cas2
MGRQFIVVAYDISDDRRRRRLHERLLAFGTPVQYSVFECRLDSAGLEKMRAAVNKIIRPRLDRVRYYRLCQACVDRIETSSGPEPFAADDVVIV